MLFEFGLCCYSSKNCLMAHEDADSLSRTSTYYIHSAAAAAVGFTLHLTVLRVVVL